MPKQSEDPPRRFPWQDYRASREMSMPSGVRPCMPSRIFDTGSVLATIGGVGKFFRDAPGWRKNVFSKQ